ncbi:MAG: ABC transporter permease [Bacteroidales bacterium]|nr:ABC transporter permease [Bacteroidales bacterium]
MKVFGAFIIKEFNHIIRDKRTILILIVMPIVQIVLFGFALSVEISNVNVAVIAPTYNSNINRLIEKIDANEYFTVKIRLNNYKEADKLMKEGKIDAVVYFEKDFDESSIKDNTPDIGIIVDASNPNTASTENMLLSSIINDFVSSEMNKGNIHTTPMDINVRLLFNPRMESSYNFVPGVMGLILIIICTMMTSISIVREKERGTMEVLLTSPVKPISIILAKMVPYFTVSFVNLITTLLLAYFVLQVPMEGSLLSVISISVLYIFLALALGLLISTLVKTQVAAMLSSIMLLMIPVIMLSGMVFPIESMPKFLQYISNIVPAKWYIMAIKKLMIEGLSLSHIIKETVILFVMTTALISLSLIKFNNRLE